MGNDTAIASDVVLGTDYLRVDRTSPQVVSSAFKEIFLDTLVIELNNLMIGLGGVIC